VFSVFNEWSLGNDNTICRKAYKKVADIIERQRMGECLHKNWIEVTPYSGSCFIHWELMPENEKKAINSIKIRICLDCKKTLEVIGYPHG